MRIIVVLFYSYKVTKIVGNRKAFTIQVVIAKRLFPTDMFEYRK